MTDDLTMAALARLEDGQRTLRVDLMARMDRLDNALTDIREDVNVAMGSADATRRASHNQREEIRHLGDLVNALSRKLMRLETRVRGITGE